MPEGGTHETLLCPRVDRVGVAVITGPPHYLPLPFYDHRVTLSGPVVRKAFAHLFIAPDFLTAFPLASSFRGRRSPLRRRAMAVVVTTGPGQCCCGRLYSECGGTSNYYCAEGKRFLCEECGANEAGLCPTHEVL